jgi:hypothetical protein
MEEQLSNKIFQLKEKLTDGEFKDLMDTLKGVYDEKKEKEYVLYEIEYVIPVVSILGDDIRVSLKKKKTILKMKPRREQGADLSLTEEFFLKELNENDNKLCIKYYVFKSHFENEYRINGGYVHCDECGTRADMEQCDECGCGGNVVAEPTYFSCSVDTEHIQVIKYKKLD